MNTAFIQILLKRIQSKSPAFYKKLRWISGILAFTCGFIMAFCKVNYFHMDQALADNIFSVCSHLGAGITGAWGLTWTGTADASLLEIGKDDNPKAKQ